MALRFKNYNLEYFEKEEEFRKFLDFIIATGTSFSGYQNTRTLYKNLGSAEMFVSCKKNPETGKFEVTDVSLHSSSPYAWELEYTGIDVTEPEDAETKLEKVLMLRKARSHEGFIPVHILCPHVLPPLFEGDRMRVQVVAQPISLEYYESAEAYEKANASTKDKKRILPGEGALLATSFLHNHSVQKNDEKSENKSPDDIVLFRGVVKELFWGRVYPKDECKNKDGSLKKDLDKLTWSRFVRCEIETHMGPLMIEHATDQVDEKFRENMKIGATVVGICILSGDVSIEDYEKGFVKDFENNLRVLRAAFQKGMHDVLADVLAPDVYYHSDYKEQTYEGRENVLAYLKSVSHLDIKCFAYPALITSVDDPDLPYGIGAHCLVLAYKEETKFQQIAFIEVNDDGLISEINLIEDTRYHFQILTES